MIVNSYEQYNELITRMDREPHIATSIHRDLYAHTVVNPVLCVGISFLNNDFYMVSVTHNDAPQFQMPDLSKAYNHQLISYLINLDMIDIKDLYTIYMTDTINLFREIKHINKVIPITLWASTIKSYHHKYIDMINDNSEVITSKSYQFMNQAIKTLAQIEHSGLAVDASLFDKFFENKSSKLVNSGLVYSQYYPYTTTGRPSNRFGGVNFSALNKTDGSRSAFISRFENGVLLQMDFESYHLRLIANVMGVQLPDEPVHRYLAKQYFGKNEISQEEYDEGKQITFSILYGADVETDIPLLRSIKELSKTLYESYKTKNELIAPLSGRKIYMETDASENKVFNYFVQSFEFERTVLELEKVLDFLEKKKSRLILYTYDAVLLDCHPDELEEVSAVCKQILEGDTYPIRIYTGMNYNNLKEVV